MSFFNTTVGKMVKTLFWVVVSAAVTYLIKVQGDLNWQQFVVLQPLVNTILVGLKNFADKEVPNFSSR